jgi:hypothetical protein
VADVLKQTLYWNANPTETIDSDASGFGTFFPSITAAQSHDANDATLASLNAPDDGGSLVNGDMAARLTAALQTATASGGISFIRVKYRGKVLGGTSAAGSLQPCINGTARGSNSSLSGTMSDYSQDFSTDPADGLAWTTTKLNAQTFGLSMAAQSSDPTFSTTAQAQVAEFSVEVWGPDAVTLAPASVAVVSAFTAAAVVAGLVSLSCTSVSPVASVSAPTVQVGAVSVTPAAVEVALEQTGFPSEVLSNEYGDSTLYIPKATFVDLVQTPTTIRSFKSTLGDQTTATKETFNSTGSGTRLEPLYGAGSQGLVGSSGAGNGINGIDAISGIKLFALVRVSKSAASSITNIRFGTTMGTKALLVQPTIWDYDAGLTDAMWQVVETDLITTGQFGQPFTWGNGVDSIWASMFGWTFNHTYSNTAGNHTQVEVAEAWVEVQSPIGVRPAEVLLYQRFTPSTQLQNFQTNINE